jgi:hypothetical protein
MNYLKNIGVFFASFVRPHPGRDWFVMFSFLVLLFLLFIVFGIYMFIGIRSGWISGVAEEEKITIPQTSRSDLEVVLGRYRDRTLNFNSRNFPLPTLFDPSK